MVMSGQEKRFVGKYLEPNNVHYVMQQAQSEKSTGT